MSVTFYGILFFLLAFFIHCVIWRMFLPKKHQVATLSAIFLIISISAILMFKKFNHAGFFIISPPEGFYSYLRFLFLYISLAFAYIVSYPAMQADSPSLIIVLQIAKIYPKGLEKEKLYSAISDDCLVVPRIKDLVDNKMIYLRNNKYKLTLRGDLFVGIFVFYRTLLNLPKGG